MGNYKVKDRKESRNHNEVTRYYNEKLSESYNLSLRSLFFCKTISLVSEVK